MKRIFLLTSNYKWDMKGLFQPKWFYEHFGSEVYSCSQPEEQESSTMPVLLQHLVPLVWHIHSYSVLPGTASALWQLITLLSTSNILLLPLASLTGVENSFLRLISFICCILCRSLLRARNVHGNWEVKGKKRRLETEWGKCRPWILQDGRTEQQL